MTAADFALSPISAGSSWVVALPGFPPGAEISFTVNGGFDISPHNPLIPDGMNVGLTINGSQMAIWINGTFPSFPVWANYQSNEASGTDGALRLTMLLDTCKISVDVDTCSIAPDSTFSATLIDTSPWLQAPPCGQ